MSRHGPQYEIITERSLIDGVAAAWKKQYHHDGEWGQTMSGDSSKVYKALRKLPANATAADVEKIIGNDTWTELECASCERKVKAVARFQRYDSTLDVCADCLSAAYEALTGVVAE